MLRGFDAATDALLLSSGKRSATIVEELVGGWLSEVRAQFQLSNEHLAKLFGVGPSTINKYVNSSRRHRNAPKGGRQAASALLRKDALEKISGLTVTGRALLCILAEVGGVSAESEAGIRAEDFLPLAVERLLRALEPVLTQVLALLEAELSHFMFLELSARAVRGISKRSESKKVRPRTLLVLLIAEFIEPLRVRIAAALNDHLAAELLTAQRAYGVVLAPWIEQVNVAMSQTQVLLAKVARESGARERNDGWQDEARLLLGQYPPRLWQGDRASWEAFSADLDMQAENLRTRGELAANAHEMLADLDDATRRRVVRWALLRARLKGELRVTGATLRTLCIGRPKAPLSALIELACELGVLDESVTAEGCDAVLRARLAEVRDTIDELERKTRAR
ncbi:MAG: hypothetical protein IT381_32275 [Deltaproteobacteria bacterium]|nr:hypothetical protein [Deltaproteobacteria bacterium]